MEKTEGRISELRDRTTEIIQSGKQKMNQLGKNMSRVSVTCVATTEDLVIVASGSQERSKTARLKKYLKKITAGLHSSLMGVEGRPVCGQTTRPHYSGTVTATTLWAPDRRGDKTAE